jgi:ABC-type multidrug transport system fused ATPase/permease subunit
MAICSNTTGAFFSFFTAMMMAYRPLKSLSGMNSSVQMGLAAATRLFTTLDEKPKIIDKENAIEIKNAKGDITKSKTIFNEYMRGIIGSTCHKCMWEAAIHVYPINEGKTSPSSDNL